MKAKVLNETGDRTIALVFEIGDEVISTLERFARERGIVAARFTAIGAFSDVVLGYFEWDRKEYKRIPMHEQVEVLSLSGDVALNGSGWAIHAHVVVGMADATTRGGHLLEAHVRPTLELLLEESPRHLRRTFNRDAGLALIDLEA